MNSKNILKDEVFNFNIDCLGEPTSVLGVKRLDVDDSFFLYLIKEIMLIRNISSTFFVYSKDDLLKVYTLAKSMKRRIMVLSPTLTPYPEEPIEVRASILNEYIDYKNYILNNYIIIVYSEYMDNKENANSFISFVINNIERTLVGLNKEDYIKHNMIFNDVQFYSDRISDLVYFSKDYNLNMLFMLKQFKDSIKEESLKFIIGKSINNIILPSAYIKDKREFLNEDYVSFKDNNIYMVTGNEINLLDVCLDNVFEEFDGVDSKVYKSLVKTFKNKISKFEQNNKYINLNSNKSDIEIFDNDIKIGAKAEIILNKNKNKDNTNLSNYLSDTVKDSHLDRNTVDSDNINVMKEHKDVDILPNKENLINTLQNININRQELDLSFDDDDDYIFE